MILRPGSRPAAIGEPSSTTIDFPQRPDWHALAACRGRTAQWFAGQKPGRNNQRLDPELAATCAGCPVRAECLAWALTGPRQALTFGYWAGMTAPEAVRAWDEAHGRIRPARTGQRTWQHGTLYGWDRYDCRCDACRAAKTKASEGQRRRRRQRQVAS